MDRLSFLSCVAIPPTTPSQHKECPKELLRVGETLWRPAVGGATAAAGVQIALLSDGVTSLPASPQPPPLQLARIRDSGATLVWVGLGTPKQDHEVHRLATALPVVALAVGAAFDFIAGTVSQAPVWMQRSGLEWSYRLAQEPRRLTKRYLWGNPRFVASVARQRVAGPKTG